MRGAFLLPENGSNPPPEYVPCARRIGLVEGMDLDPDGGPWKKCSVTVVENGQRYETVRLDRGRLRLFPRGRGRLRKGGGRDSHDRSGVGPRGIRSGRR